MVAEDLVSVRKQSVSVDELEDMAASPASSVLSAEQAPVPSKPVTATSRAGRGMQWVPFVSLLSTSCLMVVCEILGSKSNPNCGQWFVAKQPLEYAVSYMGCTPYCSASVDLFHLGDSNMRISTQFHFVMTTL